MDRHRPAWTTVLALTVASQALAPVRVAAVDARITAPADSVHAEVKEIKPQEYDRVTFYLDGWACGEDVTSQVTQWISTLNESVQLLERARTFVVARADAAAAVAGQRVPLESGDVARAFQAAVPGKQERAFLDGLQQLLATIRIEWEEGRLKQVRDQTSKSREVSPFRQSTWPDGSEVTWVLTSCHKTGDLDALRNAVYDAAARAQQAIDGYVKAKEAIVAGRQP